MVARLHRAFRSETEWGGMNKYDTRGLISISIMPRNDRAKIIRKDSAEVTSMMRAVLHCASAVDMK